MVIRMVVYLAMGMGIVPLLQVQVPTTGAMAVVMGILTET